MLIKDYFVTTPLTLNGAKFQLSVQLSKENIPDLKEYLFSVELFDQDGNTVLLQRIRQISFRIFYVYQTNYRVVNHADAYLIINSGARYFYDRAASTPN